MKLKVIGSGSSGNCYVLETKDEALVIEAGVHLLDLKKAMDWNISKVQAVLVTHSHGDHVKYAGMYQLGGGFKIVQEWEEREYTFGSFRVKPFNLVHDVVNVGFLIFHPEMGITCYVTDTHYIPYKFPALNQMIIECNYQEEILDDNIAKGRIPLMLRERILNSHMSLDTVKKVMEANDLRQVNNIVLIHLSSGNSNASQMEREIRELTGKNVHIARKGMVINFDKEF